MDMELTNVLTGEAARAGKENDEAVVDDRAVAGPELPQRGKPSLNDTGNRFDHESSLRARNSDHRNAGGQTAAR